MKPKELRGMKVEELENKLRDARLELMKLKGKKSLGTLDKPASLRNTRRLIARILTVLGEKRKGYKSPASK